MTIQHLTNQDPIDKGKKTKPSQYTLKYKKMFGEKDIKIPLELLKLYNKGDEIDMETGLIIILHIKKL